MLIAYASGSEYVTAAMQVSWLVETLKVKSLLYEAFGFTTIKVSVAATCLKLFAASNEGHSTVSEVEDATERLKKPLWRHAQRNTAAQRFYAFLTLISSLDHFVVNQILPMALLGTENHSSIALTGLVLGPWKWPQCRPARKRRNYVSGIGGGGGLNTTLGQGFLDVFRLVHIQLEPDVSFGMRLGELVQM